MGAYKQSNFFRSNVAKDGPGPRLAGPLSSQFRGAITPPPPHNESFPFTAAGWQAGAGSHSGSPNKVARWQNLIPSFPWIAPGRMQDMLDGVGAQSKERKESNFAA